MGASNIRIGQLLRLTVRFADFDNSLGSDELFDPTSVTLALFRYDPVSSVWSSLGNLSPIVRDALGVYHYDWTTPSDGKFKLVFTGIAPGATPSPIVDTRIFYVGTATPTTILTNTLTYNFLGELDPLYLDPEEIMRYLSDTDMSVLDVDIVDVTESIYRASLEIKEWFGDQVEITNQIREYLIAAVLCDLSKSYNLGGLVTQSGGDFTLGDLTITNPSVSLNTTKNNIYNGNASTWCQLAYILKNALLRSKVTFMPVVKGSSFTNPIPPRALRKFD